MPTPRQIVRDYVLESLTEITIENEYSQNVETVELRSRLARDLNDSDCPAIIVTLGLDRPLSETQGHNTGNNHFRAWSMDLLLLIRDSGSADTTIQDAGELFLADVMRCLITNRFNGNNPGKPSDIQFDVASSEFERMENGIAQFNLGINVRYDFTLANL